MRKYPFALLAAGSLTFMIAVSDVEASESYTVKNGDSLWKIALNHQVSIADLKKWNDLKTDVIRPNDVLLISKPASDKPKAPSQQTVQTNKDKNEKITYVVKPGDTLSKIAQQYKTTVASIQKANNITDHLIYVGQSLVILNGQASEGLQPGQTGQNQSSGTYLPPRLADSTYSDDAIYIVQPGDSLSSIAHRHGISLSQLKNWNGLQSHVIYVNQRLKVTNSIVETIDKEFEIIESLPNISPNKTIQEMIDHALSLQGTPYIWGGATPIGFDCSGYLYYIFSNAGIDIPRTNTVGFHARSFEVDKPIVGDIVFFSNTYTAGISHAGIYIGNNQFIHAGNDRVQVSSLSEAYWQKHFDSFKRLYAME